MLITLLTSKIPCNGKGADHIYANGIHLLNVSSSTTGVCCELCFYDQLPLLLYLCIFTFCRALCAYLYGGVKHQLNLSQLFLLLPLNLVGKTELLQSMNYNNVQDSVVECCFQLENNDSNHLTEKAIKLKYQRELDIFFFQFLCRLFSPYCTMF